MILLVIILCYRKDLWITQTHNENVLKPFSIEFVSCVSLKDIFLEEVEEFNVLWS